MRSLASWFFASFILVSGCATSSYTRYEPIEITKVIELPGVKKNDIFDKSRQWFSQYFVSGESVVDYENAEAGSIIGNGIATIGSEMMGVVRHGIHYSIRLDVKDEKMRAFVKIIKHTNTDSQRTYDVDWLIEERNARATAHVEKVIEDLGRYVTAGSDSNW